MPSWTRCGGIALEDGQALGPRLCAARVRRKVGRIVPNYRRPLVAAPQRFWWALSHAMMCLAVPDR